jgi:hypothetical protein
MHDLAELIAHPGDEERSSNNALQARARNTSAHFALVALQVRHPRGAVDYLSRRPEGIPDKPIPAWWCLFAIAAGLWVLYSTYKAVGEGEISAGRHSYWTSAKYYNRATQPTSFWLMVIFQVVVASAFVIAGLAFLRPTH